MYNYKLIEIPRISKNFFKLPYILIFLIISFFKSFFFMKKNNIQILISTGGYMSLPLCLSAKMLKIKMLKIILTLFIYDFKLKGHDVLRGV